MAEEDIERTFNAAVIERITAIGGPQTRLDESLLRCHKTVPILSLLLYYLLAEFPSDVGTILP